MTDFGPLIANPKSLLLGAAAQFGIFATFLGASAMGFTPAEAGSIGSSGEGDFRRRLFREPLELLPGGGHVGDEIL